MDFDDLKNRALELKKAYGKYNQDNGYKPWEASQYAQGLVGDASFLLKLIMSKDNYRTVKNWESRLKHELIECLWSIIVLADELDVDLEKEFIGIVDEMKDEVGSDYEK